MTWDEISKHAQCGDPLPEDAMPFENQTYQALRFLYAELRQFRGTCEESRIRDEAVNLKAQFLRYRRDLCDKRLAFTSAAYKMMKQNPDKKCSEVLEMLQPLLTEMREGNE